MKLLQVVWNFPDTVTKPFDMYYFYWPVREAVLRGWEAEVLTFQVSKNQATEEVIDGIHVIRCPANGRKGHLWSWKFIHALLTTDADIIHCHGYGEGRSELVVLLGKIRGRNVVFSPHFHIYPNHRPAREWYDKTLGRWFMNLSKRVIVFTEYTYQHLLRIGVQEARLRILPHVAYAENFNEQAEDNEVGTLLRESGITGSPLLLGVGQLIQRKGWEYTVRCLPAIIARYPDAKLLIVGPSQPAEPSFRQHLLKLANELGVQNHLYIMQDNPPAFIRDAYRSATLLTHPSFVESFGMVLLEAMMVGLPVVAHNGTGIPCIVDDGVTGFVLDVRDVNSYAAKLLAILDHPEQREKMGLAGKELARTRFSQQEISDQLFALYNEVVGNKSSPMLPSTSTQKQIEPTYSGKGTTE